MQHLPTMMDIADEQYAGRIASMVLASFMQQPSDAKTMLRQLTILCTGQPKSVLQRMVDPRGGAVSSEKWLSLAGVKDWLDNNTPLPAWKPFKPLDPDPVVPDEMRESQIAAWEKQKAEMLESMRSSGRITGKNLVWRHTDCKERLVEALESPVHVKPVPHRNSA